MTALELRQILESTEFRSGLQEISSYLSSIMQERPIVFLLAKCLWKRGFKFELEAKKTDLVVGDSKIEFKFNYNRCEGRLAKELESCMGDLQVMCNSASAKKSSKQWDVMPKIYQDMCVKNPDIFIWVLCSRDLSQVADADQQRICMYNAQRKYDANRPFDSNGDSLVVVDRFLEMVQKKRSFSLSKLDIQTNPGKTEGTFPSTYHFRICDFSKLKKKP